MSFVTFEIDGDKVIGEAIATDDHPLAVITGVRLTGPKEYNGHIHGRMNELNFCMPNVVKSVALSAPACEESPMEGEFIYAVWYDQPE